MKANKDKCHLIVSNNEYVFIKSNDIEIEVVTLKNYVK